MRTKLTLDCRGPSQKIRTQEFSVDHVSLEISITKLDEIEVVPSRRCRVTMLAIHVGNRP